MTTLTVAGVLLGGALAGCGGGTPAPAPVATPPAAAASPAPPKKPPTMAPGPEGRTPVFERRPATAAVAGGSPSDEKVVALSFDADMTADQGPRAKAGERFDNPELIALLRRLKVPATVFMTGRWAEEYPAQAKDIGADGLFEVANHSYSHHAFTADCYGLPVVAKETMAADVERAFAAFREAGVRNVVPYFRFPGGCYDDAALRALAPANVTAVQWDVVSGDAFATDAGAVARQVLDGVRPGSLVVLHCTRSAAPVTGEAVGRIVPELRKRGYRFVKVSELMEG
ncbi:MULTISPECIES: polysaccharide deacetylase family protein [Streptomyces]|uniref:Polysaccharide deacetylase n=1 Tax=Streptomyces rhizosphaericola TaxID=2564098 RepID=A0ABY2PM16_9ACTN|nr:MULTISPECIES: polysaccharide deacetylase family protein [Streptomyces]ARI51663.1 polysaccharide deacetylase [Streptomyces sp. S8]MYT92380.1 polysaccharide deacetylase family protein [Streptomyces sp. SID8359]MYU01580.1 polysaccharide deacetylase family protein [Streptomyces sp. SID8350]PWS39610.1 polysaccharide deacetylase [Streptomyces sp. ZEA17I]TGZ12115.1 polysaccharide deacetylase [Streptomyces rhizosphaericola]